MSVATDGHALMQAIRAEPEDDLPRLAYADWLDENGQGERADAIRYALWVHRANRGYPRTPSPREAYWYDDYNSLVRKYRHGGFSFGSDRGFISFVKCPHDAWLAHGKAICQSHPVVRVELTDKKPWCWQDSHHGVEQAYSWMRLDHENRLGISDSGEQKTSGIHHLIYSLVTGYSSQSPWWVNFDSPEQAIDALSTACLKHGRQP